ncbi:MAG: hypothetical protein WDA41_10420 [Candidatus Neomarinimicrobiota bacterium]
MASFSEEQKALIRQITFEVYDVIIERHEGSCKWGKKIQKMFWIGVGMGIALSLLGIKTIQGLVAFIQASQ